MRLQVNSYHVERLALSDRFHLSQRQLHINAHALTGAMQPGPAIDRVDLHVAHPGDPVRLVHVLDAVEPRCKVEGRGRIFSGLLGPPETVGEGRTHRLAGMAIVNTAVFPEPVGGLLQAREAIIDMSGPAAAYSPFSQTANLVFTFHPAPGASNASFDHDLRLASLRAAEYLAQATLDLEPDDTQTYELTPVDSALPRIAYLYQAQSQGTFADTYLYGKAIDNLVPTLIHPNEVLDGAIVSGNYVYACFKNPTWHHCNNPVIHELYAEHGRSLDFAGIVLYRGHNYTQAEKQRAAVYAAKLARLLRADGVILTGEGGGNSAIDMMLALQECERLGIKTTVISYELGGPEGKDFPLVDHVAEADAIVSAGSCDKSIPIPAMPQVLGGDSFFDTGQPANEARETILDHIYCPTNQLGAGLLTAQAY
jgi:glycine reductase complex component B subunit alpha and beta